MTQTHRQIHTIEIGTGESRGGGKRIEIGFDFLDKLSNLLIINLWMFKPGS